MPGATPMDVPPAVPPPLPARRALGQFDDGELAHLFESTLDVVISSRMDKQDKQQGIYLKNIPSDDGDFSSMYVIRDAINKGVFRPTARDFQDSTGIPSYGEIKFLVDWLKAAFDYEEGFLEPFFKGVWSTKVYGFGFHPATKRWFVAKKDEGVFFEKVHGAQVYEPARVMRVWRLHRAGKSSIAGPAIAWKRNFVLRYEYWKMVEDKQGRVNYIPVGSNGMPKGEYALYEMMRDPEAMKNFFSADELKMLPFMLSGGGSSYSMTDPMMMAAMSGRADMQAMLPFLMMDNNGGGGDDDFGRMMMFMAMANRGTQGDAAMAA